jgi:hypothetical protein
MTRSLTTGRCAFAVLVASLAILGAGCFSAEMKVSIRSDDTADVAYTVLVDVERLGSLASALGSELPDLSGFTGEELLDELSDGDNPCSELASALAGRNVESTTVSEGSRRGVRCAVTQVPVTELGDLGDDTSIRIERDGARTTVTVTTAGLDELTADGSGIGADLGLSFAELLEISFVVSAPGTLTEHNATSVDGATATWIVTPDAPFLTDGRARMQAVWTTGTSAGGGSGTTVAVIVVLGVVFAAGALVLVLRRNRNATTPGTPLPPPPPPPQPGGGA